MVQLTLQNSAHVLVVHYSRVLPAIDGRYFISTAVLLNEILKFTLSLTIALFDLASNPKSADTSTATALFSELSRAVFGGDSWKLAIPAVLYTLQNGLQYVAVSNLDASTFQIANQLKVFTTAIFSVLFLGRPVDGRKWTSLGILVFAIAIVALSAGSAESPVLSVKDLKDGAAFHEARNIWDLQNAAAKKVHKRSATYEGIEDDFAATNPHMNPTLGLLATAVSCVISGFAGTVFERIVKEPRSDRGTSIWVRNVQLSFYSIWPALFGGVFLLDGDEIGEHGFFAGYNWAVWLAIILQAVGGVAVGFLVKIDNGLSKSISGSASIALTFLFSLVFFGLKVSSYVSRATKTVRCPALTLPSTSSALWSPCLRSTSSTFHPKSPSNKDHHRSGYPLARSRRSRATSIWSRTSRLRSPRCAPISCRCLPAGLVHPHTSDALEIRAPRI